MPSQIHDLMCTKTHADYKTSSQSHSREIQTEIQQQQQQQKHYNVHNQNEDIQEK